MENIFENTIEAYYMIRDFLTNQGKRLEVESIRSKEKKATMMEVEGISWKVKNISDWKQLIYIVENCSKTRTKKRISWLEDLAIEFIKDKFIESNKHYTYNNRLCFQKWYVADNIIHKRGKNNRQAFLGVWDIQKDSLVLGQEEVPCSLGYHFQERDEKLNMNYFMRSLDIDVWANDVFLSDMIHKQMASRTGLEIGRKSWSVGSLHMFI